MANPIKIGISSCLLGQKVRYNGGHKHAFELVAALGKFFCLIPVCPEVGSGMPVPREAMHLEGEPSCARLIAIGSRRDLTDQLLSYCRERAAQLEREEIRGFVFKANSPSCGLQGVKLYRDGLATRDAQGLFAAKLAERFPRLPVGEESSLADPLARERFIKRVLAYHAGKEF